MSEAGAIGLMDVESSREDTLRERLSEVLPGAKIIALSGSRDFSCYDVLYNGTGLGKAAKADLTPLLDDDDISASLFIDANYRPAVTRFLEQGKECGAKIINGLSHMLASTALHCSIITGKDVTVTYVAEIYRQLYQQP